MKKIFITILLLHFTLFYAQTDNELEQAKKLYTLEKYTEAIAKLDQAEKTVTQEAEINIIRGNCYTKLGDDKKALIEYTKAINKNPKSARAYYNRGIINKVSEKYQEAFNDFSKCIELDIQNEYTSALMQRGFINFIINNDYEKAIVDFEKYIQSDTSNADIYMYLGICYGRLGTKPKNVKKGIDYLTLAINSNSKKADYFYYRGYLYLDSDENDKALQDFNKTIAVDPTYADAFFEIGNVYYRKKEPKKQIDNYTKAINIDPTSGKYYYWRGTAKMEQKEIEDACTDFNKAIELGYEKAKTMKEICSSKGRTYIITD